MSETLLYLSTAWGAGPYVSQMVPAGGKRTSDQWLTARLNWNISVRLVWDIEKHPKSLEAAAAEEEVTVNRRTQVLKFGLLLQQHNKLGKLQKYKTPQGTVEARWTVRWQQNNSEVNINTSELDKILKYNPVQRGSSSTNSDNTNLLKEIWKTVCVIWQSESNICGKVIRVGLAVKNKLNKLACIIDKRNGVILADDSGSKCWNSRGDGDSSSTSCWASVL